MFALLTYGFISNDSVLKVDSGDCVLSFGFTKLQYPRRGHGRIMQNTPKKRLTYNMWHSNGRKLRLPKPMAHMAVLIFSQTPKNLAEATDYTQISIRDKNPFICSVHFTCTSHGRNRNCRLRLDFSIMSMSVTTMCPSGPTPTPIIAQFFSISQPIAPAPT